jgi:hypothetical protein
MATNRTDILSGFRMVVMTTSLDSFVTIKILFVALFFIKWSRLVLTIRKPDQFVIFLFLHKIFLRPIYFLMKNKMIKDHAIIFSQFYWYLKVFSNGHCSLVFEWPFKDSTILSCLDHFVAIKPFENQTI